MCSRAFMHIRVHSLLKHYRIQQHQQEEMGLQCQRLSFYAADRVCFIHTFTIDSTDMTNTSVELVNKIRFQKKRVFFLFPD